MGLYNVEYFDIDEQGDGSWELALSINDLGEACQETIERSKEEQVTFWRIRPAKNNWTPQDGFYFNGDFYAKDVM